jgi:hypothetical protein
VTGATAIKTEAAPGLRLELDVLTPAERRDLANALLRAAWSAALGETRILLLDLLVEVDSAMVELRRDGGCG